MALVAIYAKEAYICTCNVQSLDVGAVIVVDAIKGVLEEMFGRTTKVEKDVDALHLQGLDETQYPMHDQCFGLEDDDVIICWLVDTCSKYDVYLLNFFRTALFHVVAWLKHYNLPDRKQQIIMLMV